jgi:uncharacterized membrane protein SpoIIM required for sporulation
LSREIFIARYEKSWRELDLLLDDLEKKRPTADAHLLPELYRQACHQLALTRQRLYGHDLERELAVRVRRGHQLIYRQSRLRFSELLRVLAIDFPRQVRRERGLFWIAFASFFVPFLGLFQGVLLDPELAYAVLDPEQASEYRQMYEPAEVDERGLSGDVLMFGHYIYNNVSIAFRSFAGGIFLGIGALLVSIYNGIAIGTVGGFLVGEGLGPQFWPFVAGHSSLELVGLVISCMAGLKIGLTLVIPGRKPRLEALLDAARDSMPLVWGMTAMIMAAAVVEAFWSASQFLPAGLKIATGLVGWALLALFFLFAGRSHGS